MRPLEQLVRPNILQLKSYSSARDEYKGNTGTFLDANENPFGKLNRYPDPQQCALKAKLSLLRSIPKNEIFIGNGSDEIIDLCYRVFCRPGIDKAITFSPTYGMYEVSAATNDVALIKLPLNDEFEIEQKLIEPYIHDETAKLLLICSPNNPTGNLLNGIDTILRIFKGIIVIDEAYADFATAESWTAKLNEFPKLIVIQTMSKAWGLAAARIGIAYSNSLIVDLLNKIKPPYNVSGLNQAAALQALEDEKMYQEQKKLLISERDRVAKRLLENSIVKKVYPSDANFLLVKVTDADKLYSELITRQIIIRNRNNVVKNCIRITIGNPEENERLLTVLDLLANKRIIDK